MNYIAKNEQLLIHYNPGKGAWTYHLKIPNTKDIKGKWGDLKVSGSIDGYKIERKNLAPKKGFDKLLAVNSEIREAIGKSGGEMVVVTLYLIDEKNLIDRKHIIECLKDADVFERFKSLSKKDQGEKLQSITVLPSEEKQIEKILSLINQLS